MESPWALPNGMLLYRIGLETVKRPRQVRSTPRSRTRRDIPQAVDEPVIP